MTEGRVDKFILMKGALFEEIRRRRYETRGGDFLRLPWVAQDKLFLRLRRRVFINHTTYNKKSTLKGWIFSCKRRGGDSNSRTLSGYTPSKRAHSATMRPLRKKSNLSMVIPYFLSALRLCNRRTLTMKKQFIPKFAMGLKNLCRLFWNKPVIKHKLIYKKYQQILGLPRPIESVDFIGRPSGKFFAPSAGKIWVYLWLFFIFHRIPSPKRTGVLKNRTISFFL